MKKIMKWFVPKEKKFFEMLSEQSSNALEASKEFKNFVDNYADFGRSERKSKYQAIKNIRVKGSAIAHDIMEMVDKNFRTPIDKEDIRQASKILANILNLTDRASSRFVVFGIERIDVYIKKFSENNVSMVAQVHNAILDLRSLKDAKEHCEKIRALADEARDIYNEAISELFHFYKNSIDIIKYKDIYESFEEAAEKCTELANAAESIVNRHA